MEKFMPEGFLINTTRNRKAVSSFSEIKKAFENGTVLEGICTLCDRDHNLHVSLGEFEGIIPRIEGAVGIDSGDVRDIALISRTGKPVTFVINGIEDTRDGTRLLLSRKQVQKMCMTEFVAAVRVGDIIDARITHMEPFGAFADIGAGITALLPIDSISVSRIPHPSARFSQGELIKCVIKSKENGRITLSHKELLGTWEENAKKFTPGETVPGVIRSIEKYGIFIELTPNLAGLVEYVEGVCVGEKTSVYIKSINPEKMKIKLIIIDTFTDSFYRNNEIKNPEYFISDPLHMDHWRYSPESSSKVIETYFG
ncbi:MAG: S1 RNA-binding domain-containing protein [Clostridia bacterium]|nr:S1 RNA-binding domain-containing protein [Clostridia bacterium]